LRLRPLPLSSLALALPLPLPLSLLTLSSLSLSSSVAMVRVCQTGPTKNDPDSAGPHRCHCGGVGRQKAQHQHNGETHNPAG
jgi:hypothetical protein